MQAVNVLQKSLEMAKAAEVEFKKAKRDLEARVDSLEAKVKMFEDLLAREQADKAKKIDDAKEEAIDTAWYRLWSTNPGVLDLAFLEDDLEPTLARWSAASSKRSLKQLLRLLRVTMKKWTPKV